MRTGNSGFAQTEGRPLISPWNLAFRCEFRFTSAVLRMTWPLVPGLHTTVPVTVLIGPVVPLAPPPLSTKPRTDFGPFLVTPRAMRAEMAAQVVVTLRGQARALDSHF
jgi:hypothetical protein